MAVAEASFNIWISSISSGLIPLMAELNIVAASPEYSWLGLTLIGSSNTIPSTTQSGSWLPLIEELPRILIFDLVPNVPLEFSTATPATAPCSDFPTSEVPEVAKVLGSILPTEPVKVRLSITW
ncbi:hypothetical protein D3C86_377060 [compost metagenome]